MISIQMLRNEIKQTLEHAKLMLSQYLKLREKFDSGTSTPEEQAELAKIECALSEIDCNIIELVKQLENSS